MSREAHHNSCFDYWYNPGAQEGREKHGHEKETTEKHKDLNWTFRDKNTVSEMKNKIDHDTGCLFSLQIHISES